MLYIIETALKLGIIYSFVAMALFLSYRILQIADLTTDGCYVLGMCVSIVFACNNHPILGIFMALLSGAMAGFITAFLQTYLGIPSILAGIINNTALYTINLMVMGFSSNIAILKNKTIFSLFKEIKIGCLWNDILLLILIAIAVIALLNWFLKTRLGLSIRATGDNIDMVTSSSINPKACIMIGLILANMLTALAGSLAGQLQKSADINAGNGIVTIGLATLIIGEVIINGKKSIIRNIIACLVGNLIYRLIYAFILQSHIIPIECLKLFTAIIITLAIALPYLKNKKRGNIAC